MTENNAASSARGFRVHRRELEDGSVVECFGRLTSENVPLLKDAMREACERKGRIVLDLKEVPMMDSSGLGAVVTLHVGKEILTRQVCPVGGYLAQSSKTLHFGLGERTRVDRVEIRWPSGRKQGLVNLALNRRHDLSESRPTR